MNPSVYSAKEIEAMVFPEEPWLINPVLSRGSDWLIAGAPDSFKSLMLLQLFIHASLGVDFLWFKIEKPLNILYINTDDNIREFQKRITQLNTTGLPLNDNLKIIAQPYMMLNHAGCTLIQEWVQNYSPDIMALDNLTELICGGTVDHTGMQAYDNLKRWLCSQDIGVASVTHTNKDTEANQNQPKLNRIAGLEMIRATHGNISFQESLRDSPSQRGDRFQWTMERNKGLKKKEKECYNKLVLVDELENGKTLLKEV